MLNKSDTWFERNPKKTISFFILFVFLFLELSSYAILKINDKIVHGTNFSKLRDFQQFDTHLLYNYIPQKKIVLRNWENNINKSNPIKWEFDNNGFVKTLPLDDESDSDYKSLIKVFIFGGSSVFGVGASSINHTIPSYLQKKLNDNEKNLNFSVINAGVRGYFSYFEYLKYLNHVRKLNPDIIINLNGRNDIYLIQKGNIIDDFRTKHSKYIENRINEKNHYKKYLFPFIEESLHGSNFVKLLKRFYDKYIKKIQFFKPTNLEERDLTSYDQDILINRLDNYIFMMNNFRFAVENENKKFFWFLQPVAHLHKELSMDEKNLIQTPWIEGIKNYERKLMYSYNYIISKDPKFIDLSKLFINIKDTLYIDDVHYNNNGNKIIAEEIAKYVLDSFK